MTTGPGTVAASTSSTSSTRSGSNRLVAVVLGVFFAALALVEAPIAALVSRMCWRPGWITVPWGLVLSVAASVAVVLMAKMVSRRHGIVAGAAWVLGLGLVVKGTSGGSFIIANDALGWSFLAISTVAIVGVAVWGWVGS